MRKIWTCRVAFSTLVVMVFLSVYAPQVRDLFIEHTGDQNLSVKNTFVLWIAVVGLWVVPSYFSMRLAHLVALARKSEPPTNVPIYVALSQIVSVVLAISLALHYSPQAVDLASLSYDSPLIMHVGLVPAILVAVIGLLAFAFQRLTNSRIRRITLFERRLCAFVVWLSAPRARSLGASSLSVRAMVRNWPQFKWTTIAVGLLTVVWVALLVTGPSALPLSIQRAHLLPLLLGIWVPPLTLLGILSGGFRLPLIVLICLTVLALETAAINWAPRLDPYRLRDPAADARSAKQPAFLRPTLVNALQFWMKANNCILGDDNKPCPQPIIVSAAGGASRAAFVTASVLGLLHDAGGSDPRLENFDNQLLAISAVSGSSIGVAYYLALNELVRCKRTDEKDCEKQRELTNETLNRAYALARADGQWYLHNDKEHKEQCGSSSGCWKDVLQILTAGDFLSPVMASFATRDALPLGPTLFGSDRAAVLETAIEARFRDAFKTKARSPELLEVPLTKYAPTETAWQPIVFFNATSAGTGHRIVASPIAPAIDAVANPDNYSSRTIIVFYADSFDLHDLLNSRQPGSPDGSPDDVIRQARHVHRDVYLSTAAVLSARFPVVTPHASLFNAAGNRVDRAVDGGYFEANGALTAIDLLDHLPEAAKHALNLKEAPQLWPLVLQITNDPEPKRCPKNRLFEPDAVVPVPASSGFIWTGVLDAILGGVTNTRSARGTHASEIISYRWDDEPYDGYNASTDEFSPGYAHIRICPPAGQGNLSRDLSMSWWLSHGVQKHLNEQLCEERNVREFARVLVAMTKANRKLQREEAKRNNPQLAPYEQMVRAKLRCPKLRSGS